MKAFACRVLLALSVGFAGVAYAPASAQAVPIPPYECTGDGILTQGGALWTVDMASGQAAREATLPTAVNGSGYNVLDGYVYVYDYPDTDGTAGIGRIGANGAYEYLGMPDGFTPMNFNMGEVTSDGHLWLSASGNTVVEIDVTSGSPTFMKIVGYHPAVSRAAGAPCQTGPNSRANLASCTCRPVPAAAPLE